MNSQPVLTPAAMRSLAEQRDYRLMEMREFMKAQTRPNGPGASYWDTSVGLSVAQATVRRITLKHANGSELDTWEVY